MGNCSFLHRIDLLEWLISCISKYQIKYILGDREFVGKEWFKWLIANDILFHMSVKARHVEIYKNKKVNIRSLFNERMYQFIFLTEAARMGGVNLWLSGGRIKTDKGKMEFLVISSFDYDEESVNKYCQRRNIEMMFKNLKANGFYLEDTHVTKTESCMLIQP